MLPYAPDVARGSWSSDDYVEAWAADDVLDELLAEPRRLTAELVSEAERIIDLGAGTGSYLAQLLEAFPAASATWVDPSPRMRELAHERLGDRVTYVVGDITSTDLDPADLVVTSRVVHDLPPETHAAFYSSAFELVRPGGFFFNLDHVAVPDGWDERYRRLRPRRSRSLAPHREHPLMPVSEHLARLAAAGFEPPDVPWRRFGTALLAARRPA